MARAPVGPGAAARSRQLPVARDGDGRVGGRRIDTEDPLGGVDGPRTQNRFRPPRSGGVPRTTEGKSRWRTEHNARADNARRARDRRLRASSGPGAATTTRNRSTTRSTTSRSEAEDLIDEALDAGRRGHRRSADAADRRRRSRTPDALDERPGTAPDERRRGAGRGRGDPRPGRAGRSRTLSDRAQAEATGTSSISRRSPPACRIDTRRATRDAVERGRLGAGHVRPLDERDRVGAQVVVEQRRAPRPRGHRGGRGRGGRPGPARGSAGRS